MADSNRWAGRPAIALLCGKEEDRFTAYLAELLKYPPMLQHFLADLLDIHLNFTAIHDAKIRTQVHVDGGRPDLEIHVGNHVIVVETKLHSYLHDEQVVPYARYLAEHATAGRAPALVLIAPGYSSNDCMTRARDQLRGAAIVDIDPQCVTWEQVAGLANAAAEGAKHESFRVHARSFAELIAFMLGTTLRPLSAEECSAITDIALARGVQFAWTLVQQVRRELERRNDLGFEILDEKRWPTSDYIGFKIVNKSFWFGFQISTWAELGESPLMFQTGRFPEEFRKPVDSIRQWLDAGKTEPGEVIAIRLMAGESHADAAKRIADLLQAWGRTIAATSQCDR